jgi:hypothetical protein
MAGDVFVIGYCEDTSVLIELLRVEAPAMLARLTTVEPDADAVRRLADQLSRGAPAGLASRLMSWKLWLLVAVTVVDTLVFFVPITATALLVAAVIAPSQLRKAARFLEALATGPRG